MDVMMKRAISPERVVHLPRPGVGGLAKALVWLWVSISTGLGAIIVVFSPLFWGSGPFEPPAGMSEAEFAKLKETPGAFLQADVLTVLFGFALMTLPLYFMLRRQRSRQVR